MSMMHYRGYTAKIEYSEDDRELVGRVLGIRDVIGFHGKSVAELEVDFQEVMDFYLEACEARGKTPDRPFSGKLNLRLTPEKHRVLAQQAEATGRSINDVILAAIDEIYPVASPFPQVETGVRAKRAATRGEGARPSRRKTTAKV